MSQTPAHAVTIVSDPARLDALRDEWTDLLLDSPRPNPFLSWEWMTTWLHEFAPRGTPRVIVARSQGDGRLVGLAPLYEPAGNGPLTLRTLRFMGLGVGADHFRFLVRRGEEIDIGNLLAGHVLATSGDLLDFSRMDEDAARSLQGVASASAEFACASTVADVCPFIALPGSWEEYLRTLTSHARKELGRHWRRVRECGEVEIRRVDGVRGLDEAWEALQRLHEERWREAGTRSAFATPRSLAFHRMFVERAAERGWLRLYTMRLGAEIVAAEYCLNVSGLVKDFQGGFDIRWSRYGLGNLMVSHAIQDAIAEGATEFDFLRGDEQYKRIRWAAGGRHNISLTIWRRSPRVTAVMAAQRWATALKTGIRRALPV